MQDRPRCFDCGLTVEYDPVFEAPCGHDDHASAVFHPLCLMRYREKLHEMLERARKQWLEEHGEHDPEREP